ncbi:zinc-finger domain-containing protein [Kangiella taiwanensis]|uniref:zinc-finger domain-containing protein n=1 Tax=Kangiella taiwanensis TaxID=1079179 RepID=UPI001CBB482E|nr:zinc-finger domain-containing protein [Kangiella taiwanensis]
MSNQTAKSSAETASKNKVSQRVINVTTEDLPLSCPMPDMTLWSQHPRVFIPIENGEGHCPYCGNTFLLKS